MFKLIVFAITEKKTFTDIQLQNTSFLPSLKRNRKNRITIDIEVLT